MIRIGPRMGFSRRLSGLAVVTDFLYVAIVPNVFLSFEAERALGARRGFRTGGQQVVPANGFRTDEVVFKIGVDGTGGLRGLGAGGHSPGAALVFAGGEEADEAEQFVAVANETHQAALMEAVAGQEVGCFGFVHFGELSFDFSTDSGGPGVRAVSHFLQLKTGDR